MYWCTRDLQPRVRLLKRGEVYQLLVSGSAPGDSWSILISAARARSEIGRSYFGCTHNPRLLLAGVTDHGQIRDRHVTALGVCIHAVFFHLLLRVFLHPVGFGIFHYAGNLDRMPDMLV